MTISNQRTTTLHLTWQLASVLLLATLMSACQSINAETVDPRTVAVADLSWLSGTWRGPFGERTLEEQWSQPSGGSIAALVRFNRAAKIDMLELVSISDSDNGLQLRIAQWSPTMEPLAESPQLLNMTAAGDRSVSFAAGSPGGLRSISYSNPTGGTLVIAVVLTEGNEFTIELPRVDAGE